jgi:ABC-type nickel/cobalt efflux system permease component RcnA
MGLLVALASGFTMGCLHAFDADHIAAVSALSSHAQRAWTAVRLGLAWGLGHSVILILVGGTIVLFRWSVPEVLQEWAEAGVGVLLVVLGLWNLWQVRRALHQHVHHHTHDGADHVHVHSHEDGPVHEHEHHHHHTMLAIGAAHGLAGTGAVVVLVPLALSQSPISALTFLACFGAGTMLAMAAFSYLLNAAVRAARSIRTLTILRALAGCASLVIGAIWISERIL